MIKLGDIIKYEFKTFHNKAYLNIRKKGESPLIYGFPMTNVDYEKKGIAIVNELIKVKSYDMIINQVISETRIMFDPVGFNISIEDIGPEDESLIFKTDIENDKIKEITYRGYQGVSVIEYIY